MSAIPDIGYETARARRGERIHQARSVAQADIYLYEWEGEPAVLKDFNARPAWVRRSWSRLVAAREVRVLERLAGIAGVPRVYATAGPCAFVMERVEGHELADKGPLPPPEFWDATRAIIERMHAAGVSHGDLRRKNIFIAPEGRASLIDFATAIIYTPGRHGALRRFVFGQAVRIDRVTFARIKLSYAPEGLDAEEQRWLAEEPGYLRVSRWLKQNVYRLRKAHVRQRRWEELKRRVREWFGH